jgi:hypothetical protein
VEAVAQGCLVLEKSFLPNTHFTCGHEETSKKSSPEVGPGNLPENQCLLRDLLHCQGKGVFSTLAGRMSQLLRTRALVYVSLIPGGSFIAVLMYQLHHCELSEEGKITHWSWCIDL